MRFHERELVPVPALKGNFAIADQEEAAAAQPLGVTPFENRPFSILKKIFDDAKHFGGGKTLFKHLPNRAPARGRAFRYLMVDGVLLIKRCQRINVGTIEGVDPRPNQLFRLHRARVAEERTTMQIDAVTNQT